MPFFQKPVFIICHFKPMTHTLIVQKNTHSWDSIVKKAKKSVDFDIADNADIAKSLKLFITAW